jgi:uncharacterized protein YndB with AHSA1/START domain
VLHREYTEPIEEVWAACTESARLGRWFGTYAGVGRPGGTVSLTVTGEVDAGGAIADPVEVTVHECEAPHRLVVDIPDGPDRGWRVAVTLAASGTGTTLTFEQRVVEGLSPDDVAAGWNWYLDRLGATVSGGPMPDWSRYAPA